MADPAIVTKCARCGFPEANLDAAGLCEICAPLVAAAKQRTWTERLEGAKGRGYAPLAGASGGHYRSVHGVERG